MKFIATLQDAHGNTARMAGIIAMHGDGPERVLLQGPGLLLTTKRLEAFGKVHPIRSVRSVEMHRVKVENELLSIPGVTLAILGGLVVVASNIRLAVVIGAVLGVAGLIALIIGKTRSQLRLYYSTDDGRMHYVWFKDPKDCDKLRELLAAAIVGAR